MTTSSSPAPLRRFDGAVALVTGAASGIGRAVVERLALEGASILAVDLDEDGLTGSTRAADGDVVGYVADLAEIDRCTEVVAACVDRFGRLDVLGNVAGIHATSHATQLTADQYRRVLAVNLDAPVFLCAAAIPHLLETGGSIVSVASHAGLQGVPYALAYSVSKGGLIAMTRSLAVEYLKSPLRVNAIAPAATNTAMAVNGSFPDDVDRDLLVRLGGHRPMTEPEEVAALLAFLASGEARSITGAIYTIDNGLTVS
jgi:NAD(P)-dependent dehydrogenase (short-subunit alcohol dehydrogenase family)